MSTEHDNLFYRTKFVLSAVGDASDVAEEVAHPFERVQRQVFEWIAGKEGGRRQREAESEGRVGIAAAAARPDGFARFCAGDFACPDYYEGQKDDVGYSQACTAAILEGDQAVAWVADYDEPDARAPQRHWHTNVGLRRLGDACLVNVRVVHYETEGYVGRRAEEPLPNVPRVVQELLSLPGYEATSGGMEVAGGLIELTAENFEDAFARPLTSDERTLPMVLIHTTEYGYPPIRDVKKLVWNLKGLANVYQLNHKDRPLLGRLYQLFALGTEAFEFRSNHTTIRVYMPGLDLADGSDARRSHPFYDQRLLYRLVGDAAREDLTPLLNELRRGFNQLQANDERDVLDLDDIRAWQRRIDRQRQMESYDRERAKLVNENNEFVQLADAEIKELRSDKEELERQVQELKREKSELNSKLASLNLSRSRMEGGSGLDGNGGAREWLGAHPLPDNLTEVMRLVEHVWPERIAFHEDAYRSAEGYDCTAEQAWDVLKHLATDLWDVWYGSYRGTDKLAEYDRRSPYSLALAESSETRNDKGLMRLRDHWINGKAERVEAHVKGHFGPVGKTYRAYIYFDDEHAQLLVVHSGPHLPTSGSGRKGFKP